MKKVKEKERDYTALMEIGKKTLANMKGIRHMFSTKKPYIKTTEGYIFLISAILTIGWLMKHNFPRIFYILGLQYFVWKAAYQYLRENSISLKYMHITKMFDGKVKVVAVKNDNEYVLNSFIPFSIVEAKREHIEHYFNKNVISITQDKRNLRHITIKLSDTKTEKANKFKFDKERYPLPDYIYTANVKGKRLPYIRGLDENGKVIVGDLKKDKALFVAGVPGAGKSVLESVMLQTSNFYNPDLFHVMVDFKGGVELAYYEDFDNTICIETVDDFAKFLDLLEKEMDERYALIRKKYQHIDKYNDNVGEKEKRPPILLTIDEASEIRMNTTKDKAKAIEDKLVVLMNKGRAAGIYFLICTQRPDAEQFDPRIKAHCQLKFSGRIIDKVTQNIVGVKDTEDLEVGFFKTNQGNVYYSLFVDMEYEKRIFDLLQKEHEREYKYAS